MSVRVLIVDDHAAMRRSLTQVLGSESGVHVVGEAPDGTAAIQLAAALRPDIVVMDVMMPSMDGIDATRRIVQDHPETIVIGLSVHDSRTYAVKMLRAGARAYVLKDGGVEELVLAMRVARTGHTYLSPGIEGLDRFGAS
ncbi:MAG: response regulator transcription factor [Phycisphaerales bacterium]